MFCGGYDGIVKQKNKAIMKTIETITIINGSLCKHSVNPV